MSRRIPGIPPSAPMSGARRRRMPSPSIWAVPGALIAVLALALPAIYLASTVDPQEHLDAFPVAVVVEPQVDVPAGDQSAAEQLAQGLVAEIDDDKFDVRRITPAELKEQMTDGRVYGAIVIPSDFDARIGALIAPQPATDAGLPVVQVAVNDRIGGLTTSLLTANMVPLARAGAEQLGQELTAASSQPGAASSYQRALLASPYTVVSQPYDPLPSGNGLGTSAFYYALLLVLLGFLAASTVHPTVDAALGFTPNEIGPVVRRRPYRGISRTRTLMIKWGVLVASAPVAAALMQFVAGPILDMPINQGLQLWLFSTASIAAIGIGALAVLALFGHLGALVNMIFFVALSMASSGGAVPVQATPSFFRWLSHVEPMHAVLEGTRSLLYLDGSAGSGLHHAWLRVGVGALIGLAVGWLATRRFDRTPAFTRHPEYLSGVPAP